VSDLVPPDPLPVSSPQRAELERRADERQERIRLLRQVALSLVLALALAARIVLVGG